jgi:hypothetical protein
MKLLKSGDEVAVLPALGSPPCDALGIAAIAYVGPNLVELVDGRIYFASNGQSLHGSHDGYIVLATEEHRAALLAKTR